MTISQNSDLPEVWAGPSSLDSHFGREQSKKTKTKRETKKCTVRDRRMQEVQDEQTVMWFRETLVSLSGSQTLTLWNYRVHLRVKQPLIWVSGSSLHQIKQHVEHRCSCLQHVIPHTKRKNNTCRKTVINFVMIIERKVEKNMLCINTKILIIGIYFGSEQFIIHKIIICHWRMQYDNFILKIYLF